MTPEQFVFWLSGVLTMHDKDAVATPNQLLSIIEKISCGLRQVKNDSMQSFVMFET